MLRDKSVHKQPTGLPETAPSSQPSLITSESPPEEGGALRCGREPASGRDPGVPGGRPDARPRRAPCPPGRDANREGAQRSFGARALAGPVPGGAEAPAQTGLRRNKIHEACHYEG